MKSTDKSDAKELIDSHRKILRKLKVTNSNLASFSRISSESPNRHKSELSELRKELKVHNKRSLAAKILLSNKNPSSRVSVQSNNDSIQISRKH